MRNSFARAVAVLTALTFSAGVLAQANAPLPVVQPEPQQREEAEGKFVWGILIKLLAPSVFQLFASWALKKIEPTYDENAMQKLALNAASSGVVKLNELADSVGCGDLVAGILPNAGPGEPTTALTNNESGENFQGVHVAVVVVNAQGVPIGLRPIADGFRTGERFKLRVLSTFDALVVLGNITPKGKHRQIYPAADGDAVQIAAGKEVLLPLGTKDFLQFAGDVGNDQITITVRDPRSLDKTKVSTAKVFRKDEVYGSNFVQEVKPGRYPVIAEAISIQHR